MSLSSLASSASPDDHDEDNNDDLQPDQAALKPAMTLLAEASLAAALPKGAEHTVDVALGRVIIVVVPSVNLVGPMGLALHARNPSARLHSVTEKKKNSWGDDNPMPHFSAGRTVFAVTQDPSLLRPSIHAAADLIVAVPPPAGAIVRKVINQVTGGRVRGLEEADVADRDIEQIAAAIRPGSTARECVARLKRISRDSTAEAVPGPDLAAMPLFGEAKAWAAETLADFERLRAGEILAADLENVLLFGPPGTGKTVLAKAVAKAAGVKFFDTSVSSWFTGSDGHLDGVLKSAQTFFQTLLDNAPCIGLLDELEALPDRATLDARHREWWNSVITGVLLMVTRVRNSGKPVLLIGATNYVDRVDGALKRPGRMGRHVLVRPAETEGELAELFRFYFGDDLEPAGVALAAGLAGGATPAQVEAWVKAARRVAREASRPLILDDLVNQIAPPDGRSEAALYNIALHEAGHAIAVLVLGFELKSVSIIAEGSAGGVTNWLARSSMHTLRDIEDQVVVALSGRAADSILGDGADSGARSDLQIATSMLVAADTSLGLRDTLVFRSDESSIQQLLAVDRDLAMRTERQMQDLMQRASALVRVYRDPILATAEALVAKRILNGPEVKAILTGAMREGEMVAKEGN